MTPRPLAGRRIGIVIGSLEAGGAQRMALALALALQRAGAAAHLICLDRDREMPLPGDAAEQAALATRLHVLGRGSAGDGALRKLAAIPVLHWRLERLIAAQRLELVISFMERANLLSLLASRGNRARAPRVISIRKHPDAALAGKAPLKRWLIRRGYPLLLRRAAEIDFNATASRDSFRRLFDTGTVPLSVIYNSVVPPDDPPPPEPKGWPQDGHVIMGAGRLLHAKGFVPLLRAVAALGKTHPDLRLILLGDGPDRHSLENLAESLGLADRVSLPGFRRDPVAWMARADIFALPSRAEGFPNALLEAMRVGRPVIVADCPSGPREILAPDTSPTRVAQALEDAPFGLLTPPMPARDLPAEAALDPAEAALRDGLARLLEDTALRDRLAGAARRRAADFHPDAIARQWIALALRHLSGPCPEDAA